MDKAGHCLWCGKLLPARRGRGSPRRFCSPGHRHAFGTAARRWVWRAVEAGLLTADMLKASRTSVQAFPETFHAPPSGRLPP